MFLEGQKWVSFVHILAFFTIFLSKFWRRDAGTIGLFGHFEAKVLKMKNRAVGLIDFQPFFKIFEPPKISLFLCLFIFVHFLFCIIFLKKVFNARLTLEFENSQI